MTPQNFQKRLARLTVEYKRTVNETIPLRIGNMAVSAFKGNFQTESFFGEKWKDVKRRINPPKGGQKKAMANRKILTQTGNLGRSIRFKTMPAMTIVYSDVSYADAHNSGTSSAGRGHHTVIPKRQFIGPHKTVNDRAVDIINKYLNNLSR